MTKQLQTPLCFRFKILVEPHYKLQTTKILKREHNGVFNFFQYLLILFHEYGFINP